MTDPFTAGLLGGSIVGKTKKKAEEATTRAAGVQQKAEKARRKFRKAGTKRKENIAKFKSAITTGGVAKGTAAASF